MDLRGHRLSIFLRVASMASGGEQATIRAAGRRDGVFANFYGATSTPSTHWFPRSHGRVADVARPHQVAVLDD